jgi:hypothetical protein
MEDRTIRRGGPFRVVAAVIMGVIIATAVSLITAVFVMLLWNWVIPAIFGLGVIGYWKAFGLSLLVKLLIGGLAKHFPPGPVARRLPKYCKDHRFDRYCGDKRFDDVYEDWWEAEGSKGFEDYLKKDKEHKEE